MRRTARLEADSCRRQFGEEFRHLAAPQLAPQHWLFDLVNPMNLKDMFRRVQTNSDNRHSDGSSWLRLQHPQPGTFDAVGAVHSNIVPTARSIVIGNALRVLEKFEETGPWVPAYAGTAKSEILDFPSRSGYLPRLLVRSARAPVAFSRLTFPHPAVRRC